MSTDLVRFLRERLADDERIARAASGGTVVGAPGDWRPSPAGDEWEAYRSEDGDEELLVALRPGLPRPVDLTGGLWGAVVSSVPDHEDAWSPMPQFEHAARHDPARVLAEVAAKREVVRLAERAHDYHETFMNGFAAALEDALRLFALPYAGHREYRPEWAPEGGSA